MRNTETAHISIVVNGERHSVPSGLNILQLLDLLQLDPARVAVEKDRGIVRRPAWASTDIQADAEFEIVQFVGGG